MAFAESTNAAVLNVLMAVGCAVEVTHVIDWLLAIPRRHRIPRRQSNVPCRSSGNVIKTTNYWDVLQPRCGRRSTMGHVGKAVAFQGMEIPGRKRRIISSQIENCRGQLKEAVLIQSSSVVQSNVPTEKEYYVL